MCDQESSYTTCILLNYRPEQFLKTSEIHLDTPLGYLEIRVQKGEAKFLFRMKCSHLAEMFDCSLQYNLALEIILVLFSQNIAISSE